MKKGMKKNRGFKAVAKEIAAKQNLPIDRANAIVAAGARKASPAAIKANPRLKRIPGVGKKKGMK